MRVRKINLYDIQTPFVCSQCYRLYKSKMSLYNHRRYECGKAAKFQCPHCPHKSVLKGNLTKHIANKHAETLVSPQEAPLDVRFDLLLKKQLLNPMIVLDWRIREVAMSFLSSFPCLRCWKTYRHPQHLWRHKKFECGVEPQFKCPVCPHKSKRKENLKVHLHTKHKELFSVEI
ncbi:hypothetical protein GE061_020271 [Apolygus lucorum]|uniref:C2H2-type domain-containing protein n=1 Tax=Apolygus lucorum TaxID=248454 RepID=A0A8S9WJR5_APOLU|nr:hypothetical protein GE061_020271 [Apolygus lucorum]